MTHGYEWQTLTAEELLDELSLTRPRWWTDTENSSEATNWYFRGQSNCEYKLLPAAHRLNTEGQFLNPYLRSRLNQINPKNQECPTLKLLDVEIMQAVIRFHEMADQTAMPTLSVPISVNVIRTLQRDFAGKTLGLNESLKFYWKQLNRGPADRPFIGGGDLVDSLAIEAFAIAQHHGIPTPLLDWTSDPRVAAWFAASEAQKQNSEFFSVHAINRSYFRHQIEENKKIWLLHLPTSGNRNMISQKGTFTLDSGVEGRSEMPLHFMAHDEQIVQETGSNADIDRIIQRFRCKTEEANELIERLYVSGIHKGTIFPSLDAIAEVAMDHVGLVEGYKKLSKNNER